MTVQNEIHNNHLFDVTVVGGGPAGALCAAKISAMQYKTLLIDPNQTAPRIEGLSPRAATLLHSNQMFNALDKMSARLSRTVHWGKQSNTSNGEHLVFRPSFDHALRVDASDHGAQVCTGRVSRYRQDPSTGWWEVQLSDKTQYLTRFLVDARGRQGQGNNRSNSAPANVALSAFVDGMDFHPGTLVKALEKGWLWLARQKLEKPVWAQLMLHKGAQALGRTESPKRFLSIIEDTVKQSALTINGKLIARGADFRLFKNSGADNPFAPLRIGDASAAFDPLSGHGMFWAFSSALSAAAIVNTRLRDSSQQAFELCKTFYQQRLQETFWRQARVGRDFYQMECDRDHTFWRERKAWPDEQASHAETPDRLTFFRGPAIEYDRVVERELVQIPGDYGATAWFGSIPLAPALRKIQRLPKDLNITPEIIRNRCVPLDSRAQADQFWHWLQSKKLINTSTQTERGY